MFSNYGELKDAVQAAYLGRTDIPDYVYALATAELNSRLRLREMEASATVATVAGTATIAIPSGFLMLREAYLDVNPRVVLDVVDGWSLSARHDATGRPGVLAVTGSTLTLDPTPDAAYNVVLRYVAELDAFSADADTNTILTKYPALYLYVTLMHVAQWAQDMEMAASYLATFERELDRVQKADRDARYAAPLRARVSR